MKITLNLVKFIVASTADEAVTLIGAWRAIEGFREVNGGRVFDDEDEARAEARDLTCRAEEESPFGCKVPCDEHSRCVGFDPQVWEVSLSVSSKGR